jgi:hypothetical protein
VTFLEKHFYFLKTKSYHWTNFPVVDLDLLLLSGTLSSAFDVTTNTITPLQVETTSTVSHRFNKLQSLRLSPSPSRLCN